MSDYDFREAAIDFYHRSELKEMAFPISEQFGPTIQGEGPHAGKSVQFLRTGGCNLSCWWCDTPETWDASRFNLKAWNPPKRVDHIIEDIIPGIPVVLTGGEPLMHQKSKAWETLLAGIRSLGCEIHIETNGTIAPNVVTQVWANYASVSPKLAHAGSHKRTQDPTPDPKWRELIEGGDTEIARTSTLKFVVRDEDDIAEALRYADDLHWPRNLVWVMPEGTDIEELQEKWPSVAKEAARLHINASHRIHVLAWGHTRGT
jgi:7-carboxy-7-deazaguanine synthase